MPRTSTAPWWRALSRAVLALTPVAALAFGGSALAAPPIPAPSFTAPPASSGATETNCTDGIDDDGDMVTDCGDHDCHEDPACQPDGEPERGEERCGNWVDDDGDGVTDCEDDECAQADVCLGSWDFEARGQAAASEAGASSNSGESKGGVGATGAIGENEDPDTVLASDGGGERNNYTCSDGIDNDNDGFVDCQDVGCKLDPEVTVCQAAGDFRFSIVARLNALTFDVPTTDEERQNLGGQFNTEFDALQLRMLGQIPFIQNSFFLISARAEQTPRVTFATFKVPIRKGHYVAVNSGGGGLSYELARSAHKRMLLDAPFYMYNAFEQGNGGVLEFGGPLMKNGKLEYRTFLAGGSGRFTGNIGGSFFPDGEQNYSYTAGAQIQANIIGYYSRFDTSMLYAPVPTTLALQIGAKYDQRPQERYPAVNVQLAFKWRRLILMGETYGKRELNFRNWQLAYNVQFGVLAVKRRLFLAADFGQYVASDFENPPNQLGSDLRRQLQETQARGGVHVWLWRNVFYLSLLYRYRLIEVPPDDDTTTDSLETRQDARLTLTYRF